MYKTILLGSLFSSLAWATPDAELKKLMLTHINTTNEENLSGVLATMDSSCPDYPQQSALLPNLFEQFDLKYTLEEFQVLTQSEQEATIGFTLCTEKLDGPNYRNNRIQQMVKVNKTEQGWKLCSGKIMMIQYLDIEHTLFEKSGPTKCQPSIQ